MTDDSLKRGTEIKQEKDAIQKFVESVEKAITVPANALPPSLRDKIVADGLAANLDALVKVWSDQKLGQLEEEFKAL